MIVIIVLKIFEVLKYLNTYTITYNRQKAK